MQTALIISQIFLNFSVFAVVLVGTLFLGSVLLQMRRVGKALEKMVTNLDSASGDVINQVQDMIEGFGRIPFLSYFLRKRKEKWDGSL